MSKITNKPSVTDNYGVNVRRAAIEQRGKWAAGFYVAAREEGIDLEPIMRKAIHKIGVEGGQGEKAKYFNNEKVTASGYAHYFTEKALSETFEKSLDYDTEDEAVVTLHYCALLAAWQKMGLSDEECALMCDIAMEGDRGIAEGVGLDFDLEGSLADGCECCTLRYKTRK
jgi:hypothetical protein